MYDSRFTYLGLDADGNTIIIPARRFTSYAAPSNTIAFTKRANETFRSIKYYG
jgi:hypothetical protein